MPVITTYASMSNRGFSTSSTTSNTYWLDALSLRSSTGGMYNNLMSINNTPCIFGSSGSTAQPVKPYAMSLVSATGAIDLYTILATRPTSDSYQFLVGMNKDSSGNLHVLFRSRTTSINGFNLIKLDSANNIIYNKVFSGTSSNIGYATCDLIKDSSDYLYVFSFNSTNFVLTKIDPTNYTVVWSKTVSMTINLTISLTSNPKCLYIDKLDNIYVVAYTTTGTLSTIFKFNTSGTILWQQQSANFSGGLFKKISFDNSGNVYLGTNTGYDPTIVKLDGTTGSTVYAKTNVNSGFNIFVSLIINSDGNIILLGRNSSSSLQFFTEVRDPTTGAMTYTTRVDNTTAYTATDIISIAGSLYVTCNIGSSTGGGTNFNVKFNNNGNLSFNTPWSYSYTTDSGSTVNQNGTLSSSIISTRATTNASVTFTSTAYSTSNFNITITDRTDTLGTTVPFEYYTILI